MSLKKITFLYNQILDLIAKDGNLWFHGRLPTVRVLADRFDTSQVTIIKVLRMLRDDGKIMVVDGKDGYFIPEYAPDSEPLKVKEFIPRYREIYETLREEIVSGLYSFGESIPSLKEIRTRFSCGHSVVREAITELLKDGLLEEKGRRLVHRVPAKRLAEGKRICFSATPSIFNLYQFKTNALVTAIENDIERLGWGHLDFYITLNPLKGGRSPKMDERVAAHIYFAFNDFFSEWISYFDQRSDTPLIVIDPSEKYLQSFRTHYQCIKIVADNKFAGREIGTILVRFGHKHIALISHVSIEDEKWAFERCAGLRELYPDKPTTTGQWMSTFVCEEEDIHNDHFNLAFKNMTNLNTVLSQANFWPSELISENMGSIYNIISTFAISIRLEKIFDQAIQDPSITAWVCINDDVAALAHSFLMRKNIPVSRNISIIGFDNSPISYKLGITSYDFSFEKMGHLAIQALLSPGARNNRQRERIAVNGRTIIRRSLGSVKK